MCTVATPYIIICGNPVEVSILEVFSKFYDIRKNQLQKIQTVVNLLYPILYKMELVNRV